MGAVSAMVALLWNLADAEALVVVVAALLVFHVAIGGALVRGARWTIEFARELGG